EHVPDELRERWFGLEPRMIGVSPEASAWLRDTYSTFVERDISSSQTQLLAVFLNEPSLEELACDPSKKFKVWLAEQLWALHERENVLAPGYAGADDDYLIAFIKEVWMRRNYGGKFSETVRDL